MDFFLAVLGCPWTKLSENDLIVTFEKISIWRLTRQISKWMTCNTGSDCLRVQWRTMCAADSHDLWGGSIAIVRIARKCSLAAQHKSDEQFRACCMRLTPMSSRSVSFQFSHGKLTYVWISYRLNSRNNGACLGKAVLECRSCSICDCFMTIDSVGVFHGYNESNAFALTISI